MRSKHFLAMPDSPTTPRLHPSLSLNHAYKPRTALRAIFMIKSMGCSKIRAHDLTSTSTTLSYVSSLNSSPRPPCPSWREDHILLQRTFWMVLLSTCTPPNPSLPPILCLILLPRLSSSYTQSLNLSSAIGTINYLLDRLSTSAYHQLALRSSYEPDDAKGIPRTQVSQNLYAHCLHTEGIPQLIILLFRHQIRILEPNFKSQNPVPACS